uniref:ATP synthase subunit a n=1 Tax=Siphonodentalium lobatum TaxID=203167 RepID=Q6VEH2_9MOLL|nr:ATP synthase F0 subunit 6 [Siphonodentalium lobatum]AAP91676.1 ATP synthase F0 subunit 6 [Siphonodentalium lobatum]
MFILSILSIFDNYYFWIWPSIMFMMTMVIGIMMILPASFMKQSSVILIMKISISSLCSAYPGFKMLKFIILPIFLFLAIMNITGLVPYLFSSTSHFMVTLCVSMPTWLSFIISSLFVSPKNTLKHLVPMGSPMILSPFMVMIELVSIMVRPITLGVRLGVNVMMGHLMLSLMGWYPINIFYTMFEVMVALLQAYIFVTLLVNYCSYHTPLE